MLSRTRSNENTLKFIYILSFLIGVAYSSGAHKHITHYEYLNYEKDDLHSQHLRVKRSTNSANKIISLQFQSHERHFNLRLLHDDTVFHPDFKIEDGYGNLQDHDVSHLYHGTIYGQKNSKVHGSIIEGVFRGVIKDETRGTFYVDHVKPFFGSDEKYDNRGVGHSVIYHENAIDFPHKYGNHETCGMSDNKIEKYMEKIQSSGSTDENLKRKRRALAAEKNTCLLYISTDHVLWREYENREVIVSKIAEHVKAISEIYGNTKFETSRNVIRNIGFMVKRMMINTTKGGDDDPFANEFIGVEKFLEYASYKNHDKYCLSYVFTNRDFDNGVLGLAWVGSVQGSSGGICDKYTVFRDGVGKSLNTGIITFKNYGSSVPSKVSHITFAHEVGHNFGSPHDSGSKCAPGSGTNLPIFDSDDDGNYIMYASATSGTKPNNRVFSECSKGNMSLVLEAKKDICFVESDRPICGNGIIDKGEECDCGFEEMCQALGDADNCYEAGKENECTLKPGRLCSVSQGPCCNKDTGNFYNTNKECSQSSDCRHAQKCSGDSALCNIAVPKSNKTVCNHGTQVCWNGECSGSICEAFDLKECQCKAPEGEEKTSNIPCRTCCHGIGNTDTCKSTDEWSYWNKTIFLQPGSPCGNFEGYCDVFSRCRKVDAEGPLSKLKSAILNPALYNSIRSWIVTYWWAVLLMAVAALVLMLGFIQLCSVHTPSNNPRLPKARELPGAGTLRRRRERRGGNSNRRHTRQRPAYEMQYR